MSRIDRIITEVIRKYSKNNINEAFQSQILRDYHQQNKNRLSGDYHGAKDLGNNIGAELSTGNLFDYGLSARNYLDKITDDMIAAVGTKGELSRQGFTVTNGNVYDMYRKKHYTIEIEGTGRFIVFNNDANTISKLQTLSKGALSQKRSRKGYA